MALFNNNRPALAACALAPLVAMASTASYAQTWKINLRDADLAAFINEVADITGKNFAVDPRVRGNVTVISNKPLNKNEVYDLFLGVLNVNGVVAIPSGNTVKLVPDSNVKSSGIPYDARRSASGDQIVTRVIWLENTNANDLIPALRPLMPQFAHLSAVGGTNALIVSDRASNIYQLETIIRNLDGTGQNDIEAVTLQSSQAEEMIGLLDSMTSTGAAKDAKGSRVRIIADSRTNRIIIKGDTQTRKRIRQTIEMLDVPPADRLGGLKVFRLKYASSKNLAEILQGLVRNPAGPGDWAGGFFIFFQFRLGQFCIRLRQRRQHAEQLRLQRFAERRVFRHKPEFRLRQRQSKRHQQLQRQWRQHYCGHHPECAAGESRPATDARDRIRHPAAGYAPRAGAD